MTFLRRAIASAYWRSRYPILRLAKAIRSTESADSAPIARIRESRLAQLLRHAAAHTHYYRRILSEAGIVDAKGKVDLDGFGEIPLLTKTIVRGALSDLISDDLDKRRWYYNTSGGSTGEPVRLVQDRSYSDWSQATKHVFDEWTGYRSGEPKIIVWGAERDIFAGGATVRTRAGRWVRNETWLNAFKMSPETMRAYVDEINRARPTQILAYAESLYDLAKFAAERKIPLRAPGAVMTSAGVLYPHMRSTITEVFQTSPYDRYGSREVGDVGCECAHHAGLHISPLTHFVEVLRPDGSAAGPHEEGEIVITLLTNYAMPLIRYRIGDLATKASGRCLCGRHWPRITAVSGRTSDIFVAKDGTRVHGYYFAKILFFMNWIHTFQVLQETSARLLLRIVPTDSSDLKGRTIADDFDEIRRRIRLALGEDCQVEFQFVERIDSTSTGKHLYTMSRCDDH